MLKKNKKAQEPKKTMKRFVFGMMMAGGALGLAGLSAQAHGNASSHKALQLSWNFDDYVVKRQEDLEPFSPNTLELSSVDSEIRILEGIQSRQLTLVKGTTLNKTGPFSLPGPGVSSVGSVPLSDRVASRTIRQLADEKVANLTVEKLKLQNRLQLTPETRTVLNLLSSGKTSQARAFIESTGSPEEILNRYSLVQIDLYNYGAETERSTPAYLNEIINISKAAVDYHSKQTSNPQNSAQLAAILHNLASAAAPDIGGVSAEQFAVGRDAAERAIKIREQLGDKVATGIAYYMSGVYAYRDKDYLKAQAQLSKSVQLLESTAPDDLAWSKAFLGLSQIAAGDSKGESRFEEARNYFHSKGNTYAVGYLSSLRKG